MSQQEMDEWNASIDRDEAAGLVRNEQASKSLLNILKMPEDEAISSKRLTGFRVTDEHTLRIAKRDDDAFEYDPAKRLGPQAEHRKSARTTAIKTQIKRKPLETFHTWQRRIVEKVELNLERQRHALKGIPGTPLPASPVPECPRTNFLDKTHESLPSDVE